MDRCLVDIIITNKSGHTKCLINIFLENLKPESLKLLKDTPPSILEKVLEGGYLLALSTDGYPTKIM